MLLLLGSDGVGVACCNWAKWRETEEVERSEGTRGSLLRCSFRRPGLPAHEDDNGNAEKCADVVHLELDRTAYNLSERELTIPVGFALRAGEQTHVKGAHGACQIHPLQFFEGDCFFLFVQPRNEFLHQKNGQGVLRDNGEELAGDSPELQPGARAWTPGPYADQLSRSHNDDPHFGNLHKESCGLHAAEMQRAAVALETLAAEHEETRLIAIRSLSNGKDLDIVPGCARHLRQPPAAGVPARWE